MIRNLFKRIAEFITGSSSDDDNSAIPFAKHSRKKAAELSRKERAERQRRNRDKKQTTGKPQQAAKRGEGRGKADAASDKRAPATRAQRTQNGKSQKQAPVRKAQTDKAVEAPARKEPQKKPRQPAWSVDEFIVPEKEGEVRFHDLDLPVKLMHGIFDLGFQYATPIQAGCLPETLKGSDAIGKAQTGTGKSAAFLITIINHLAKKPMRGGPERGFPRALVLAPTRELALQIEKDARDLCKHTPYKILSLFGGTGYEKQKKVIAGSVDIIVATPGRLIDFKHQKLVDLSRVEILVIDEADRMLDMGFIPDIRKIVYATPHKDQRQTLFFSATYSDDVTRLAEQWTRDPHRMEIEPEKVESESIDQKVFLVTTDEKFPLLYNLIHIKHLTKVLVFTNRRDQARRLAERLNKYKVKADLLSGEVAQNKRIRALEDFRSGKVEVLVATDVAARGLHIDEISHVINYNLPQDAEHYVHRIGRTGRAGAKGTSVSFACEDDSYYIPAIEELLGHKMDCEYPADELLEPVPSPARPSSDRGGRGRGRGKGPVEEKVEVQDADTKEEVEAPVAEPSPAEEIKTEPQEASDTPEALDADFSDEEKPAPKPRSRRRPPRRRSSKPRSEKSEADEATEETAEPSEESKKPEPKKRQAPQRKKAPAKAASQGRKSEAPMPTFDDDEPKETETVSEKPEKPKKVEKAETAEGPQASEAPEKPKRAPARRPRKKAAPLEAKETKEPSQDKTEKPNPSESKPKDDTKEKPETPDQAKGTPEPKADATKSASASPRATRRPAARTTRTPHAPKQRKRPGTRYTRPTRKES